MYHNLSVTSLMQVSGKQQTSLDSGSENGIIIPIQTKANGKYFLSSDVGI